MAIKAGDKMPAGTFKTMTQDGPQDLTTDQLFKGKKVVLFSVPAHSRPPAMPNICRFREKAGDFKAKGVDTIACMAVNDVFVMGCLGQTLERRRQGTHAGRRQRHLRQGVGTRNGWIRLRHGIRGQRFAVVVQDGVAKNVYVEAPKEFKVSAADYVLAAL